MNYAVTTGRWIRIGHSPLEDHLLKLLPKFIQDPINQKQFSIYENGSIRSATKAECLGLERAAVWDPEHVEERLKDHFAGRSNKYVELMRIRGG